MEEALGYLSINLLGWLLGRFRAWADRTPDRDPSQLPLWHRLGRIVLGLVVSLAFLAPYLWIARQF